MLSATQLPQRSSSSDLYAVGHPEKQPEEAQLYHNYSIVFVYESSTILQKPSISIEGARVHGKNAT